MQIDICTIFEKDYHYGLGALANSLVACGFKGRIWAAYIDRLPWWASDAKSQDGFHKLSVGPDVEIRFFKLDFPWFGADAKPSLMLGILERNPEISHLAYIDPDIVVRADWKFFELWIGSGVGICADVGWQMPDSHPIRLFWKRWAQLQGFSIKQVSHFYFNSGFVSLAREQKDILAVWHQLMEKMGEQGVDLTRLIEGGRENLFYAPDQDALNIALMTTDYQLSVVGPDGMDFVPGGFIMSHAAGVTKPWRKSFIKEALGGIPPNKADRAYLEHSLHPIALYSSRFVSRRKIELKIAAMIGRFIRRS